MDKDDLEKEKLYLEKVERILSDRIKESDKLFADNNEYFNKENKSYLEKISKENSADNAYEISDMQRKLEDITTQSDILKSEAENYKRMVQKPYFASIDVTASDTKQRELYYIGVHTLNEQKQYYVLDWRSPIASVYYDFECGKAFIVTDNSKLPVVLNKKRQFKIEQGDLKYFFDSDITINDEILKDALGSNKGIKLKSIVETIQKEQNAIIRDNLNKILIVDGVAGSGKTVIALHRIAYLLYKLKGKITSNDIVMLSPNSAFSGYISTVLPELSEKDVLKFELDDIAKRILKKTCIVESKNDMFERIISNKKDYDTYVIKSSKEYFDKLHNFCVEKISDMFIPVDFELYDKTIDSTFIKNTFFNKLNDMSIFNKFIVIANNVFDKYFYTIKSNTKKRYVKQLIFEKLYTFIPNKNCIKLYFEFLKKYKYNYKLINDKLANDDVYPLLYIYLYLFDDDKFKKIKHIFIDEVQDYTYTQLQIIKSLFNCDMTITGDKYQTITKNNFVKDVFNDGKVISLNKSYRNTLEISDFAKYIGNVPILDSVKRHGKPVELAENTDILKYIKQFTNEGFKTIAVITKTMKQAMSLEKKLSKYVSTQLLSLEPMQENCIYITSAFNSKGLEFDAIIVYDVDELFNDLSTGLLFVAVSRALHRLVILSNRPNKKINDYFTKGENND